MINLRPIIPLLLHHSSFFHVVELSGNVWVWESWCGYESVVDLRRYLEFSNGYFELSNWDFTPPLYRF